MPGLSRCVLLSCVAVSATVCAGGPLVPPSGGIGSTGRTTLEIEPRVPISAATTPGDLTSAHRITAPGSYFLMGDVFAGPGQAGIRIEARDVRLDLRGFAIRGGVSGIVVVNPADGMGPGGAVTVWDGAILNASDTGIDAVNTPMRVYRVDVTDPGVDGIVAGPRSRIVDSSVIRPGHTGMVVGPHSTISHASVMHAEQVGFVVGNDSAVADSSAIDGRIGFTLMTGARADRCTACSHIISGYELMNRASVQDCTAALNFVGVRALGSGARIEGNQLVNNGIGVSAQSPGNLVVRNVAHANGTPFDLVSGNTAGPTVDGSTIMLISNPTSNIVY